MRLILGGIALVLAGTLTGCVDGGTVNEGEPTRAACQLLNRVDRETIDGTAIDREMPAEGNLGPRENQCGWASRKANIRVISMASTTWADVLPAALDQLEKLPQVKLSAADRAKLDEGRKLLDDKALLPDQACDLFVTLAKLEDGQDGSNEVIRYLPLNDGQAMTISAQTCSDGRFTSVTYTTDGMQKSVELEETMADLRYVAHRRAIRQDL
ncbi:hypothetical protein [Aeromicrobium sp. NPDC092404]|uniref:hypothetical protein n=1 Tax=Aeromicrobium sp. NPDC092404 TaxID=3154976 RepID=UPI003416BCDC